VRDLESADAKGGTFTMRDKSAAMTCEEFQAQFPKLMGERVDIADIKRHPHAQKCKLCMELLEELELIAEEAERRFGEWNRN
jgi:hypothetical protein